MQRIRKLIQALQWADNIRLIWEIPQYIAGPAMMIALAKFWGELSQTAPTFQAFFWIAAGIVTLPLVFLVVRTVVMLRSKKHFVEFYTTRTALNRVRGGITAELDKATVVYAAWPGASIVASQLPQEQRAKVKRLLLRNPGNAEVPTYAAIQGWETSKAVADINHAVARFRVAGTDVRWLDAPLTTITIGDPDTKKAWARVEVVYYSESDNWQNYVIRKKDNEKAYSEIFSAFNKMWNSQWASEPPPSPSMPEDDGVREGYGSTGSSERQLQLDVGRLLLDGKDALRGLEKMDARENTVEVVLAESKFGIWWGAVTETLQDTPFANLWDANKVGEDFHRTAHKQHYIEACQIGLDRLESIKQLMSDTGGSRTQ